MSSKCFLLRFCVCQNLDINQLLVLSCFYLFPTENPRRGDIIESKISFRLSAFVTNHIARMEDWVVDFQNLSLDDDKTANVPHKSFDALKKSKQNIESSTTANKGLGIFDTIKRPFSSPIVQNNSLGTLEKLPCEIRIEVWKLLAPKADYIRRLHSKRNHELRYDRVPSLLLTSRTIYFEFSIELYRANRVLRTIIHPTNPYLTFNNSLLHGPKSNVDFSRFETLRIEFIFPFFPPPEQNTRLDRARTSLELINEWVPLIENHFREVEEVIFQRFSQMEEAEKPCPALEIAFVETETGSWWEMAKDMDGWPYQQNWVENNEFYAELFLRTYRYKGKLLRFHLDPKAGPLSRRALRLLVVLLTTDEYVKLCRAINLEI